ncbi:efflux RND transporter periplasmic adaptor subunit [Lacinutrix undariae]
MTHFKYIIILMAILGLSACKNDTNSKEEVAHSNSKTDKNISKEEDSHGDEVMLTDAQFKALKMEKSVLSLRNMSGYVEANGELEVPPQNEAAVTAIIGANVNSIEVIEGDKIEKNQVLAYLSHPNIISMQTNYLNAFSNSSFLKNNYERQKKLYEAGVGSGMNFQKAESEYQASKAVVKGLEAQLKLLNLSASGIQKGNIYQRVALRSPIEGYVQKVEVKTGQYVDPQTELFEIVDTHHVHADLMVFEKDAQKIKKGQTVRFNVQSDTEKELVATVYSVGKTFEENPKAIHVHAEIENKNGNLIPGMYIRGKIEVETSKTQAIPEGAIVKDGDSFFVFTVETEGENWSFKPVEIIKGVTSDGWVAITLKTPLDASVTFAVNNAYYLIAELKKGESAHSH